MWRQKNTWELQGNIGVISYVLTPSSSKLLSSLIKKKEKKKRTVQPEDALEGTADKPGFGYVKY